MSVIELLELLQNVGVLLSLILAILSTCVLIKFYHARDGRARMALMILSASLVVLSLEYVAHGVCRIYAYDTLETLRGIFVVPNLLSIVGLGWIVSVLDKTDRGNLFSIRRSKREGQIHLEGQGDDDDNI